MAKISEKIYCAFCRVQRKVFVKKHLHLTNVLLAAVLSLLVSFLFWSDFIGRALIIFSILCVVSEVVIQMRWRISLPCPYCGFDPLVYLKDPQKAAERVKQVLESKKKSSEFILSRQNPFENLPTRKPPPSNGGVQSKDVVQRESGTLSKQV